jgi:hypothetical protein
MKKWKACCTGLVLMAGLGSRTWAQGVAVPAPAVVAPAPVVGAVPAAAPAAAPANLWTFLCPPPEMTAACKAKFCESGLGRLLNNGLNPLSTLTGGLVPSCCPPFTAANLAKPADSPEGAADRIKKDEAEAKARRAAVRYLGTVDCHYWPEAQEALVNALRADRNECVRLEAAWALGRGCCCTRFTIQALAICVEGSDRDGNPSENSDRVRAAAQAALAHCLACFVEVKEAVPVPAGGGGGEGAKERSGTSKGQPATPEKMPAVPAKSLSRAEQYRHRVETMSRDEVLAEGRRALEQMPAVRMNAVSASTSGRSVLEIVKNSLGGSSAPIQAASAVVVEKPAPVMVVKPGAAPATEKTVYAPAPGTSASMVTRTQPPPRRESLIDVIRGPRNSSSSPRVNSTPAPVQTVEPMVVPVVAPEVKPAAKEPKPQAQLDKPRSVPTVTTAPTTYRETTAPQPVVVTFSEPATRQPAPEIKVAARDVPPVVETKQPIKEVVIKEVKSPVKETRPLVKKDKPTPAPATVTPLTSYREMPAAPALPVSTYVAATSPYAVPTPVQQAVALAQTSRPLDSSPARALSVLHDSAYPDQREWAANSLAAYDGWRNPQVVQALIGAAKNDEAPMVRAACLRSLARMDVRSMPVLAAMQAGQTDGDPRVRYEADQALTRLNGDASSARPH